MTGEPKLDGKQDVKISEVNLRSERTNLRRFFTKAANTFDEVHRGIKKDKDIHVVYRQVVEKAERLFSVDEAIKNSIALTDDDYETTEEYRDRFAEVGVVYERNYNKNEDRSSIAGSESRARGNLGLPKLQLKEYDLMPRSWVSFWGQFSRIHEDESLREEDKFQYLLSSLKAKTKGRDIVESYPPTKDNYEKVIEHLKARLGRKDLLIEVYIRDLLALVESRSGVKLTDLYDRLGSYLRALETLGVTTAEYAAILFPVVESCLPTEILKAWDRYRMNKEGASEGVTTKERDLENLMSFLRHEVEGEEHRVLAEQAFGGVRVRNDQSPVPKDLSTAAVLFNGMPSGRVMGIFCDGSHSSEVCWRMGSMSCEDRSALETKIGWAVLGVGKKKVLNMVSLALQNAEVSKLWDVEVLGITDPVERKSNTGLEEETLTHFRETLRICEDGCYEVSLPWLAGHLVYYDESDVAETRLRSVTGRLLSEENCRAYDDVLRQWDSDGIVEVVPKEQIWKPGHYIPHRPGVKLSSSTKKIRPVFDASYRRPGYASLSEGLSVGPSLIPQIQPIVLRFRLGAFGVIADIKQAFLQIRLKKEDNPADLVTRACDWFDLRRSEWWEGPGPPSAPWFWRLWERMLRCVKELLVIEVFPGKDGVERVVKLRVATGGIIRPVQRICPLELEVNQIAETPPELEFRGKDAGSIRTEGKDSSDRGTETDRAMEVTITKYGRKVKPVQRFKF